MLDDGDRLRLDGDALYRGRRAGLPRRPADRRVGRRWRWRRPGPGSAPSCRRSRTPPPSTCAASATCCSTAAVRRASRRRSRAAPWSSSPAARAPSATCATCAAWLRATEPVLVGVDEGADALLAAGLRPHLVVGDPRLMSDDVLECGAELVVRAERDGTSTGCTAPSRPAWSRPIFALSGSSEDAALLLVDAHQPALIVGVGWHPTLAALVDSGRATCRARSSPGSGSATGSSTPPRCRRSTAGRPAPGRCGCSRCCCWPAVVATVVLAPDSSAGRARTATGGRWVQDVVHDVTVETWSCDDRRTAPAARRRGSRAGARARPRARRRSGGRPLGCDPGCPRGPAGGPGRPAAGPASLPSNGRARTDVRVVAAVGGR